MSTKSLINFFTTTFNKPVIRAILLFLYYLIIIIGLILMYGKGDFSFHSFVYQAF